MTAVFVRPDAMNHCKNPKRILQESLQESRLLAIVRESRLRAKVSIGLVGIAKRLCWSFSHKVAKSPNLRQLILPFTGRDHYAGRVSPAHGSDRSG
jgi:hypothetical protein